MTEKQITKIFLDQDGVLCDWIGGVCKLFGLPHTAAAENWPDPADDYGILKVIGCTKEELWAEVDKAGAQFWADLYAFPWVQDLWDTCSRVAPTTILTTPGYHSNCTPESVAASVQGKHMWLNKHLGDGKFFDKVYMGKNKFFGGAEGHVLIDDRDPVGKTFIEGGGKHILFPLAWNARANFCEGMDPYHVACGDLYDIRDGGL